MPHQLCVLCLFDYTGQSEALHYNRCVALSIDLVTAVSNELQTVNPVATSSYIHFIVQIFGLRENLSCFRILRFGFYGPYESNINFSIRKAVVLTFFINALQFIGCLNVYTFYLFTG